MFQSDDRGVRTGPTQRDRSARGGSAMKKLLLTLVLAAVLLTPAMALAGSSTDAALGLGAFAVFNQILGGVGVFGGAQPAPVYAAPPPAPVVYAPPPPPVYAAPVYAAPVYAAPVYAAPVYAAPVYVAPRPVVVAPVYVRPRPVYYAPAGPYVVARPHHHKGHYYGW